VTYYDDYGFTEKDNEIARLRIELAATRASSEKQLASLRTQAENLSSSYKTAADARERLIEERATLVKQRDEFRQAFTRTDEILLAEREQHRQERELHRQTRDRLHRERERERSMPQFDPIRAEALEKRVKDLEKNLGDTHANYLTARDESNRLANSARILQGLLAGVHVALGVRSQDSVVTAIENLKARVVDAEAKLATAWRELAGVRVRIADMQEVMRQTAAGLSMPADMQEVMRQTAAGLSMPADKREFEVNIEGSATRVRSVLSRAAISAVAEVVAADDEKRAGVVGITTRSGGRLIAVGEFDEVVAWWRG